MREQSGRDRELAGDPVKVARFHPGQGLETPWLECRERLQFPLDGVHLGDVGERRAPEGRQVHPSRFAGRLGLERGPPETQEVARTAGLGRDAVQRKERARSDRTQRRLREMVEVIKKPSIRPFTAL